MNSSIDRVEWPIVKTTGGVTSSSRSESKSTEIQ
jgi:hypothetical protein